MQAWAWDSVLLVSWCSLALRDRGSRKGPRDRGAPLNPSEGAATASHRLPGLGGPEAERGLPGVRRRGPISPALSSHPPRPSRPGGADPGPGRFVPPPPYKAAFVARGLRRTR